MKSTDTYVQRAAKHDKNFQQTFCKYSPLGFGIIVALARYDDDDNDNSKNKQNENLLLFNG